MGLLSYDELVGLLGATADQFHEAEEYVVKTLIDLPGGVSGPRTFHRTFASPSAFILLRATPGDDGRTLIQIAGGGARGALSDVRLFQHLLSRYMDFDWGGPFALTMADGTVTYGSRITISSDLISSDNKANAYNYIAGLIDMLGQTARILANELVPHFGGTMFQGDPKDGATLCAALLGPRSG